MLAKARFDRLVDLRGAMQRIRLTAELKDGATSVGARQKAERLLALEVDALKRKLGPDQTYLEMARQVVREFLESIEQ